MSLTYRPTTGADLESCFQMVSDRGAYGPSERETVLAFWEQLLQSKAALSRVVEDRSLAAENRMRAFFLSIFVSNELNGEIKAALGPHVGLQIALRWRRGRPTFLDRREIARRNSEERLHLLVIAQGTAWTSTMETNLRIRSCVFDAFVECHRGYSINEAIEEIFNLDERTSVLSAGGVRLRDFDCCAKEPNIDGGAGSALIALHRDRCDVSNPMWGIFHPPRPVFHFSDLEKDVLEAALHRGTDEEISRMLDLSIWTIKKRWQRVYEKVERIIPDLLAPKPEIDASHLDSFGSQRRRHLLDYLRQLPHEIRPTMNGARPRAVAR